MANVIEVEAGGKIFEFPAGTSRDVMTQALRKHFGFQEPQPTVTPQATSLQLPSDFRIPVETPPSAAPPIPEAQAPVPRAQTQERPLVGTMYGFDSAFPVPEEPVAAPAAPTEPPPYASRVEALDDAVNMLEEGADQAQVFAGFGRLGITPQEITQHGQARGSAMFQQERVPPGTVLPTEPSGQMQAFEPGMAQQIADDFKRAKTSLSDQMTNFLLQTGGISPVDAAQLIRRNARQRSAAAPNETIQRGMAAIGESETFGDAAKAMLDNPRATWAMLVDSILTSAPGLAATLVVAPAGIPARAAAAFLTSGGMEYASVMTDVLQDKKVDLTDAEQVAKALQNPEILAEMKEKGAKRGLIIGGFDAISMGLAGRFVGPANELISAGKLTGAAAKRATVAAWSKELALQMAGGAGGEFAAQQATGENKPAAVLLEALGEAVLAPLEVRSALSEAQTREAAARPEAQIARAIQEGVDASSFVPGSSEQIAIERLTGPQSLASQARAEAAVQAIRREKEPELPTTVPAPATPEPSIITEPAVEGRPEPTITTEPPVIGREEPLLPGEAPTTARVAPLGIGLPDVEEENLRTIKTDEEQSVASGETPVVTVAPPADIVTAAPTEPPPSEVSTVVSEGIPIVYPLVSALKLSDDVPQFKEDADQQGVVNKLTGKFDWRDFGAIQVWQRLNGNLEVISGRHRLDLAQRSGVQRVPAQIYREADGFTAQDAAILDAELNIRDEKGTVKDYVQYFQGSGITQEEAQSRGLLDNVKGQRAFNIANFGSPELIASHGARQLSDEAASQIALAAPQDSRLQAVGLKVRQDGKSDEAAVNAVRAVKAIAREQNTTTDMFGFDDSLIKEAVEMAKIAERKQKELANRINVLSKVSKNPKIAEQEGIDIKDPKAVAARVNDLKAQRAAWNNWDTNPDLINEIRRELGGQESLFGAPAEPAQGEVVETNELPNNMETRVVKTSDGYASLLFDKDANKVVDGSVTRYTGDDALEKAKASAKALADKATPSEPGTTVDENDSGFRGASDQEVKDVAKEFKRAATQQDENGVTRVFDPPKKTEVVRIENKARVFVQGSGYLTLEQARQRIEEWKKNAQSQGETRQNNEKVVLSLFDMTGEWSKPWEDAGYQVYRFDIQTDPEMGDVTRFDTNFFNDLFGAFEGQDVYAILAACPCTDFASSGARHFAAKDADGSTVESVKLVQQTLATIEYFKPSVWAIENPVGRIEKLTGLPPWRLSFNPNHFGDPYTKKTLLWGRFNADLPIAPVEPTEGSKMHRMYGGKSAATKNARSVTPEGFAYAFFQANNAVDNPVMALANKYDMMNREVFEKAVEAGMSDNEVSDIIDDPYYFSLDYKQAEQDLLTAIEGLKKPATSEPTRVESTWNSLKTEEMPGFDELSPDAQATVQTLIDQGQLTPDVAREIAEDDEINRASPLRQEETIKAKVGVNKARVAKLLGQQLYGVTSEMPKVTLKELFQNAFDATKEALEKGQIQQGNISIVFNEGDRSIEVIDNGMGMPSSVMGKEFLEIAGSKKGTARSSGGFGIAKIQFLYGNKQLEVISLRDGVLSKMVTTGDVVHAALEGRGPAPDIQIIRDPDEIQQAIDRYFPEGHGTSVKVTVPDSYEDPDTRQTVQLPFDGWELSMGPSLRLSPLFTDVNVQVAKIDDASKRDTLFTNNRWRFDDVEIGSKFPTDSYAPVSSVKFPWGSAVVYTSTKPTSTNANFNVLSNGLWQFTEQIGTDPFKPLPRAFYIDVIPSKSAGDLGYPFELNRQGFTKAAEQDINAIKKYLKILYSQTNLAEDVKDFGTVQYINNNGTVTTPAELKPSIPVSGTPTLPTIKPTDKVEIKDGRMSVNGKVLPDISEKEMKDMKIDVDALTIDQGEIDANKVLFHNNAENKNTKDSLYKMAVDKFGEERVNKYFYGVGKTFLRLRNALVSVDPTYADMAKEGVGISLDINYLGVNIRVPFKGMFINPSYAKISDTPAQVAVAMMGTMQHEMAHFKHRNHGSNFASEMQRINALLDTHPSFDIFALKKYFIAHMKENEDIFNFLKTEFDSGNLQPIGKRFADSSYEQIRDDGDSGAVEGAGRGREGRPGVPEGAGEGVEAARESTEPTGVPSGTEGQRGRDSQAARQEVDDLLNQYNRPVVLGRETKDAQRTLLPTATRLKEIYKSASDADGRAADSLNGLLHRGLAFARNKLFFSGAGLEEADARRYGRQLVTDNDQATATLALDNMLHGGGIAVEFLTRGGIEYNPNTKRIQAVKADQNMMDVYRLQKGLVDELGDKTAKGLINGYFEAKRSQSIKDEMASLTEDLEEKSQEYNDEYNNLQALLQNSQSSQTQIASQTKMVDRLKKESQELKQQLDDITQINEDKVLMDDDEIAAFIDQENNFPQLRQMMDSWTAQNHRLLGLMRQVRLISEKRYDRLIGIKDYVPWQRVQDDDGDVHGPAPSRSVTRIPKEPKFKKGKVEAPIEYAIDNMTDNILRLTMNSLRQYAAGRIVSEYATRNEKGQVKTFPKEDRDRGRFAYISDGRRVVVEIKDPLIAEAVYGSDSVDLRMNEALAAATNFVRRAITVDPFFQMAQVVKDAPTAAIVTGVRNPAALMGQVMTSFAGVLFDTDPVADILRANGIGGFQSIARTPEKRLKQKVGLETRSIPQATLALLDHIGDASDFAARMAAYKRTMAETGNEELALWRASNVINFNRIGSSRIVRQFIRYVNFANAYLQSVDTLVTALSGRGMRGQSTARAMTQVALTMSYLAGATLLYSFLIGDDDEYQKLDDATKVRNFFIPKKITKELGMENGILIPMNTTASFMFKALPELTYQNYVSQATQSPMDAARYRKAVAEAAADALLGPEPVPSAIRPIVEIAMNRSFFTEKSLTPRGMETLEKSRQFTDQTSELAKQLGQFGGLSPIEWDHLIRGTTGTAGMLVQYGSNMIGEALNVRPESTTKQLPGVGRFVAPEFGRGREALFYDLHERVRKATSTLKDLEATGELDKADKFAEKNEDLLSLSRWSNRTEARLKKLNAEIRLLSRGKEEGTAAERRRDIRELQQAKEEELEGIEFLRKVEAGL